MDTSTIMFSLLFGSIGVGYLIYGRKQKKGTALFSGVALCVVPYLVSNIILIILIGLALIALPFFIDD